MLPDFIELEASVLRAIVDRRWDDLAEVLHDDFAITTAGWLDKPASKRKWIDEVAARHLLHDFEILSVDVREMQGATVVLVLSAQSATGKGKPFQGHFRYTDVWRCDDANRWRLAVRHASLLPPS